MRTTDSIRYFDTKDKDHLLTISNTIDVFIKCIDFTIHFNSFYSVFILDKLFTTILHVALYYK